VINENREKRRKKNGNTVMEGKFEMYYLRIWQGDEMHGKRWYFPQKIRVNFLKRFTFLLKKNSLLYYFLGPYCPSLFR
jgi:hypothetical protein